MKHDKLEVRDTKVVRFIIENRYRLLRHLVLLIGILAIISFSDEMSKYSGSYRYYRSLCVYSAILIMSYINMYILVPRFFFKGSYILYLALLLLLVMVCLAFVSYMLHFFLLDQFVLQRNHGYEQRGLYEGTIILIPIILVTTMIKLFQRWTRDNERINELKNISLTMELNELRNQINPHFLFNMLNGIKALVRTDQEKAATVIMKLSEFLRYQLYENNEEKVLLKSEIGFLSNFLELEKIRRDNLLIAISSNLTTQTPNSIFLPPNLFTIFVENAVKHSVNISSSESYIRIIIEVITDKLYFICINSKDPEYIPPEVDLKNSGLGLINIKRRLELLYGEYYILDIESTKNEYIVKLTIPI
jgi:sensor histidine kinase YesM